jgi:fatty-acid desaturase
MIKITKEKIQGELAVLALLAFSTWLLWWQISPQTYNDFDRICKNFNYDGCMRWYWQNLGFFQVSTLVFLGLFIISLIVLIYSVVVYWRGRGKK